MAPRWVHMQETERSGKMRKARGIVSQRLRLHFQNLYAELDRDTEGFFQRVMQQADARDGAAPLPSGAAGSHRAPA